MKNFIGILFNDIENIYKKIKNINDKVNKLKIKFENYEKERNIKNIIKKKKKEVNDWINTFDEQKNQIWLNRWLLLKIMVNII